MSKKILLIIWGMILFVSLVITVQAQVPIDMRIAKPQIDSNYLISLQYGDIDTRVGPIDIPLDMTLDSYAPDEKGYYIVQYEDVLLSEWRAELEGSGAEIMGYVPNYAYLVRIANAKSAQLTKLDHVQWVGIYQPAYRVSPHLYQVSEQDMVLTVMTFPKMGLEQLVAQLEKWGGEVIASFETELAGTIRVEIDSDLITPIARYNGVMWIEPWVEPEFTNDVAREIMDVEDTVWDTHGLYGSGQIVGIADTGLDIGQDDATINDDFEGRIVAAYGLGRAGDWGDPNGHGTHVAGSVLGNGSNSGSNRDLHYYANSHAGVAPEAELVFQSTMAADGRLSGIPVNLTQLFQPAYNDGARIHTNSWGQANPDTLPRDAWGNYNEFSFRADEFSWNNSDMLILFSAGNNGTDADSNGLVDEDSVGWPGTAKNVLTVGATENVRDAGGFNPNGRCETWGGCWRLDFASNPIRDDGVSDNRRGMAAFSSRGPVDGNRIKPDLVAPGTNILSVRTHQHTLEMDAESGDNGWIVSSPWSITNAQAHSGNHSWTTGAYSNNVEASLTVSPTIDTRTGANAITFWTRYELGAGADGFVEYLAGTNWVECDLRDYQWNEFTINGGLLGDTQNDWVFLQCFVPNEQNLQFRFRFASDDAFAGDGWFVDDIYVTPIAWGYHFESGDPNENYFYMGGTSMATPLVAGAAALVREYYTERLSHTPSSALMRATLVNGAENIAPGQYTSPQEIQDNAPNNVTGWGRVNVENALYASTPQQSISFVDVSAANGLNTSQSHTYEYTVDQNNVPLHATLVWTDHPGFPPAGSPDINNDLDLIIRTPNGTIHHANGRTDPDRNNNTEDIVIGTTGAIIGTHVITVTAHNIFTGPQGYGLVVRGGLLFKIIEPVNSGNPALAGPHNNPRNITVRVTNPAADLGKDDYVVTIGGKQAQVVGVIETNSEYVLDVIPPSQDENGFYELTVATEVNSLTVSDVELDVVLYDDGSNVNVFFPLIVNPSPIAKENDLIGTVTASGIPAEGLTILLNRSDSTGVSNVASAVTDSMGRYSFKKVPLPQDNSSLTVRWNNDANNDNWLSTWACWDITASTTNPDAFSCDFDIANVELLSPDHNATLSLPAAFSWKKRALATDEYEFNIADMNDFDPHWWTDPALGYVAQYTLSGLPAGFSTGDKYGWWAWVNGPDGYGLPYYYRFVTFDNTGEPFDAETTALPFSSLKSNAELLAPPRPQPSRN